MNEHPLPVTQSMRRAEARGVGARHYAPVYLQLRREEIDSGLAAHWNAPTGLREWLAREGGLGTTAVL